MDFLNMYVDKLKKRKWIKKINKRYSAFIKNTSDNDEYTENIKKLISDLLYDFSKYSISAYFPSFEDDFNGNHNFYIDRYLFAFENYYIKNNLVSESQNYFFKDDFFKLWRSFKNELTGLTPIAAKEIGPQTYSLYKFVTETQKKYSALANPPKKSTRFWTNYVCRTPNESNYKLVPSFDCHLFLRKEELPFYLVLYAIYNYSDYDYEHEAFSDFGAQFRQFQQFGEINEILLWCVSCYCEWYTHCTKNSSNYDKYLKPTDHIPGIPLFLEHFGFFWHKGLQENKNQLLFLFDTLSYNPSSNSAYFDIPFIINFFSAHRLNTQPLITEKEVLNKKRKREKSRSISEDSSYIERKLEEYFLLKKGDLKNFFRVPLEPEKKEYIYEILDVELRQFISSLFLAFISVENDYLAYINTHLYFNKLIYLLSTVHYDEELPLEQSEIFHEKLWRYILQYIDTYTTFTTKDIYNQFSMPYYNELLNHTSLKEDELNNYICMHYLSAFSSDDSTL